MILSFPNLHLALMTPTKFWFNPTKSACLPEHQDKITLAKNKMEHIVPDQPATRGAV